MEAYIKKYFWTLNLVTIALCSYMAAKTTNLYLGEVLYSEPQQVEQKNVQPRQRNEDNARKFEHKAGINPFTGERLATAPTAMDDSQVEVRDVEAEAEDILAYGEDSECVTTSITGTLMGTMVSSNPESSFAIIEINGKAQMFEVRQSLGVGDAHVVGVFRHKVFVRNNGRIECFFHGEQGQIAKTEAVQGDEDGGDGIRKISETEYIISQDEINKAIDNINLLMTQARVVPSFKDGKSNGFRIYSIKPGSLYRKIGIKNGDILQKINENELSSPDKALELYTKLRTEKRVAINLLRRGQPVTLDYTIQ